MISLPWDQTLAATFSVKLKCLFLLHISVIPLWLVRLVKTQEVKWLKVFQTAPWLVHSMPYNDRFTPTSDQLQDCSAEEVFLQVLLPDSPGFSQSQAAATAALSVMAARTSCAVKQNKSQQISSILLCSTTLSIHAFLD